MPQPGNKMETRRVMDAAIPRDISAVDREKLLAKWDKAAVQRAEDVLRETKMPSEPSHDIKLKLSKFGRYWQSYWYDVKTRKWVPILPSPSLSSSAVDVLCDRIADMVQAS